jgi:hypothetical protein
MWAIRGRIVAMSNQPDVAASESTVFTGRVWIGDDGRIVAVTPGRKAGPPGSDGATVVDVGSSLVIPGLVDLHNHLAYNTLPLWTEPKQHTPFLHHNSWTKADTYAASTTWPAYALITACPQELLAYVEAKAIVGGTTSIQGSPPKDKPRDGWLVRNIDDETFGSHNANLIYASVLTMKTAALADRANKMRDAGAAFIYHCLTAARICWRSASVCRGRTMMSEFDTGPPPAAMIQKVPHPSSHDAGKLITDWRAAIEDLRTAVTPDPDGDNTVSNYGTRFSESDYAQIPPRDLPFGVPSWLGDDAWGRRATPKHNNSVERPAEDRMHTIIWRAPQDLP